MIYNVYDMLTCNLAGCMVDNGEHANRSFVPLSCTSFPSTAVQPSALVDNGVTFAPLPLTQPYATATGTKHNQFFGKPNRQRICSGSQPLFPTNEAQKHTG